MVSAICGLPYTGENEDGVGTVKKIWLILLVVVLVRLASMAYYETKLLEKPIIVASVYNEGFGVVYVGYITNRLQPVDVSHLEYEGGAYYSESPYDSGLSFGGGEETRAERYQDYSYYALYTARIQMRQPGEESEWADSKDATLYFMNNDFQEIEIQTTPEPGHLFLSNPMSSSGTDGHESLHIAEEDFELQEIVWDEQLDWASVALNRKTVEIPLQSPLEIKKGDRFEVSAKGSKARFLGDWGYVYFRGADYNGKPIEIPLMININQAPSSEWIEQRVKEEIIQ